MPTQTRHEFDDARDIGYDHGWDRANYTDAYGDDPHTEPDIPNRFSTVAATTPTHANTPSPTLILSATTADRTRLPEGSTMTGAHSDALTLPDIARQMLSELIADTTSPHSVLPNQLQYGIHTDPDTHRVRISVYGFTDPEIDEGPDHLDGIELDMREILGTFAADYYGATWGLTEPAGRFHLLVSLLNETEQRRYQDFAATATMGDIPDHELNDPRYH